MRVEPLAGRAAELFHLKTEFRTGDAEKETAATKRFMGFFLILVYCRCQITLEHKPQKLCHAKK